MQLFFLKQPFLLSCLSRHVLVRPGTFVIAIPVTFNIVIKVLLILTSKFQITSCLQLTLKLYTYQQSCRIQRINTNGLKIVPLYLIFIFFVHHGWKIMPMLLGMYRISGSSWPDIWPFFRIRLRFRPKWYQVPDISAG